MISIEFRLKNSLKNKLPGIALSDEFHYVLEVHTYETSQMVTGYRVSINSFGVATKGKLTEQMGNLRHEKLSHIVFHMVEQGATIEKVDGLKFSGHTQDALNLLFCAAAEERAQYAFAA